MFAGGSINIWSEILRSLPNSVYLLHYPNIVTTESSRSSRGPIYKCLVAFRNIDVMVHVTRVKRDAEIAGLRPFAINPVTDREILSSYAARMVTHDI